MKITQAEAAAMLEAMPPRTDIGADLQESLARHLPPAMLAGSLASLPEAAQHRIVSKFRLTRPVSLKPIRKSS